MPRLYQLLGWSYVGLCLFAMSARETFAEDPPNTAAGAPMTGGVLASEEEWFRRVRPYCNTVEIGVVQRQTPAPATVRGAGFAAACYALAGNIDEARRIIDAVPNDSRYIAAGVVFDVGHPVADAGDDRAAGPIMELVVDYWPNHYMALYHAGMAEYMLGQRALSQHNLEQFLATYQERDGWRANAEEVLHRLGSNSALDQDVRRPREPGQ